MKEHIDNHHVIGANMDGKADRAEETGEGQKLGGFGTLSVYIYVYIYIYTHIDPMWGARGLLFWCGKEVSFKSSMIGN